VGRQKDRVKVKGGLMEEAPQRLRFLNYLLDWFFCCFITFFVILTLHALGLPFVLEKIPHLVLGFASSFIYYSVQEGFFGRTLGKLLTHTKVVNEDGSPLTLWRGFIRTLCRFIPLDALSYLVDPVGWHDVVSKTRVV
jgi:uncharacterized RDD family membrane protein YckC